MVSVPDITRVKAAGHAFLAALSNRDWGQMEACFTPDVTFRALIPPGVREGADAAAVAGYFRRWFGDADELILAASDVQEVEDRLSPFHSPWVVSVGRERL
jgi:hypothetical protein